jgi:hypothetical protein
MTKYPILIALAATFLIATQSCKKKGPDLTTEIVGTYNGSVEDSVIGVRNTSYPNQQFTVTKIDNSHVRVTSDYSGYLGYEAELIATSNGLVLNIPSQDFDGETVAGYDVTIDGVTANGSYISATRKFFSLVNDDASALQGTEATKQ